MSEKASYEELVQKVRELEQIASEHKQSEHELRESEERFHSIVGVIPDLIIKTNREGIYLEIISSTKELLYKPKEEILGSKITDVLPNEESASIMECLRKSIDDHILQIVEYKLQVPAGKNYFEARIFPLGKNEAYALIRDITERKRAEESLRQSEEKYRQLFNNAPIGIGIADEHGNIIAYNDAMLKPGGYSREDMKKIKNLSELYYDPKERKQILAESAEQGFIDETEVFFKRKDGTPYAAIMSLRPIKIEDINCWQAVVLDITDRKRAEKEKEKLIKDLQDTLGQVKTLKGLLPICSICKNIRDDQGYWNQIEAYIRNHSEAEFSHSICPECAKKMYPDFNINPDNSTDS